MKKRHLFLSLLLIMGCSDKKSQEEIQDLDRIVQQTKLEISIDPQNEEVMR